MKEDNIKSPVQIKYLLQRINENIDNFKDKFDKKNKKECLTASKALEKKIDKIKL